MYKRNIHKLFIMLILILFLVGIVNAADNQNKTTIEQSVQNSDENIIQDNTVLNKVDEKTKQLKTQINQK